MRPDATKAAVFHGPGRELRIEEVRVPSLDEGDALIQVECATLCGSDLHTLRGGRAAVTPLILGHEVVGRVVESAGARDAEGSRLAGGERVVVGVARSCGECDRCSRGLTQKCRRLSKLGHDPLEVAPASGGMAAHVVAKRGVPLVRVHDDVPGALAAQAGCATATAAACLRAAGMDAAPHPESRLLVLGCGALGVNTVALARHFGAREVVAVDPAAARRALVASLGARVFDVDSSEFESLVGEGFDAVVELAGTSDAAARAIELASMGGRVVLAGAVLGVERIAVDPERVVRRLLRIEGVHNYRASDLVRAVRALEEAHATWPRELASPPIFDLDDAQAAVELALSGRCARVGLAPHP